MWRLDKTIKKILFLSLASRVFLLIGTLFLVNITDKTGFYNSFLTFLTTLGGRWDGNHYVFIAQNGYVTFGPEKTFIVFPPFYPLLIKIFNVFFQNPVLTGVILSNLLFVLGCLVFYNLLRLDYSEDFSQMSILLLSLFPTAYFFSVAYPESLYLFLACASLFLVREGKFLSSSFFAGLATLTKPFGILLWPAILAEWYKTKEKSFKNLFVILFLLMFSSGVYLLGNFKLFGDLFAFQKFLVINWHKSFVFPWTGIAEAWKRAIFTPGWTNYKIFVGFAEAITATAAWLTVFFILIKGVKMRFSYFLYYLLGAILFTSTGFILSSPRYLLSLPPFFIVLTQLTTYKIVRFVWATFSLGLMFYLSFVFAKGGWAF